MADMKTAKGTHGKRPSSERVGAYSQSYARYTDYPGETANVQEWPSHSGMPKRTGNLKKSSAGQGRGKKGGY